ncbi:hypothetical protein SMCF_3537 [Streptomyces coelicoflavus ZG0656]|nr:hypothetical protein SMCF_3537 [Streptomyces coelicoflavus ZG0656]
MFYYMPQEYSSNLVREGWSVAFNKAGSILVDIDVIWKVKVGSADLNELGACITSHGFVSAIQKCFGEQASTTSQIKNWRFNPEII